MSSNRQLVPGATPYHGLRGAVTILGLMIVDLLSDGDTLTTVAVAVAVGNNPSTMNVSDQPQKRS